MTRPTQGTVVLVGCGARKSAANIAKAEELYTGTLFAAARAWAEKYGSDWGVLSAAYGCIPHDWVIQNYDKKLIVDDDWNRLVQVQVNNLWPSAERLILLAPEAYTRWAKGPRWFGQSEAFLYGIDCPMEGMGIGQRMAWLTSLAPPPAR